MAPEPTNLICIAREFIAILMIGFVILGFWIGYRCGMWDSDDE